MRLRPWLIYAVVYSFFLASLGFAEVRKVTRQDIEWTSPTYPSVDCTVTSAGGHVGNVLDNTYQSSPLNQTNQVHNGSFEWWSAFVSDNTVIQADGWRNGGNEMFTRESTITYHGNYSLKMRNTPITTTIGEIYQNIGLEAAGWIQGESWDPKYWSGKTVTFGCWIKATDANRAYTVLNDDVAAQSFSTRHTGDNTWQWLPVTKTLSAASTAFQVGVFIYQGSDITIYVDGCTLSESIPSGNGWIGYSDKPLIAGDNKPNDPDRVSPISFHSLFQLKNPNVSHGMTNYADNNVYAKFFPVSTGTTPSTMGGGMRMYFFSDANDNVSPLQMYSFNGIENPGAPAFHFSGGKKSGTGAGALADLEYLWRIDNYDTTVFSLMGNGNAGFGITLPTQKLSVDGGVQLVTSTARPTCDNNVRGTFWVAKGADNVADTVAVCAKDNVDAYDWRTIY